MGEKCATHWCDFCGALLRTGDIGNTVEFSHYVGERISSRIVFESTHFAVIASLGQIVEGYLLLLSKPHYPSMSHLPPPLYEELNEVYSQTRQILRVEYCPAFIFEHGPMPIKQESSKAKGGGSCVDHAHFHFVPLSVSLDTILSSLQERFPWRKISHLTDLCVQASRRAPYFFTEFQSGERFVYSAPSAPPQYIRRLISTAICEPDKWNWHVYPETDRLIATAQRLQKHSLRI